MCEISRTLGLRQLGSIFANCHKMLCISRLQQVVGVMLSFVHRTVVLEYAH